MIGVNKYVLFNGKELKLFCKKFNLIKFNNINVRIDKIVIDSRKVEKGSLFVAITGENNDGHRYIKQAMDIGAVCVICEKIPNDVDVNIYKDVCFIVVDNSVEALQNLARFQRSRLKSKVIGITGNIGKTTTREMIRTAIGSFFKTTTTECNYNNHIGLPLTIVNTPIDTEILILEMGMNHIGEIDFLTRIARPDVAVITKIAPAHIGNFNNIGEIVKAKAEIFNGMGKNGTVILDGDGEFVEDFRNFANQRGIKNIITVGSGDNNDVKIKKIGFCNDLTTNYEIFVNGVCVSGKINGLIKHNVFNSLFAFAVARVFNLDLVKVADNLENFQIVNGRGNFERKNVNGKKITIINDCYNSSPDSLSASINTLSEIKRLFGNSRCVAIIGDMLELGEKSKQYHSNIADVLISCEINNVVCIGEDCREIFKKLPNTFNKLDFKRTDDFCDKILDFVEDNDILLLKASHGMHFEKIIDTLSKENND